MSRKLLRRSNSNDAAKGARSARTLAAFKEAKHSTEPPAAAIDESLSAELAGIAADVHMLGEMESAGIMADYAARMLYAQRHYPKHLIAGILRSLKDERKGRLADLKQRIAMELKGRLAVARARHRRGRPPAPQPR